MTRPSWNAFAFALLLAGSMAGADPAEAQGYRGGDRDWDRGRDDRDWDRGRGDRDWDRDRRRRDWDDDRRGPGFRFEFGSRERDRRCHWVSRRSVDDDGDVVIRRRRVCD
jgi:hypothetical protein